MSDPYIATIDSVLAQFKVDARVATCTRGPCVTRYSITLGPGVKVEKVSQLAGNLAYATAVGSLRVLAPIPGESAVGIEIPSGERQPVALDDIPGDGHPLSIGIGLGVDSKPVTANLAEMPHLLVSGTTGSGKSSFINSMLVSLMRASPEQVKMLMIDPKMVELTPYDGIPHLLQPVITEVGEAIAALTGLVAEMDERYQAMREARVRNISALEGYPYIVVVVDELADLMMAAPKEVEGAVVRLAQKARAAGIHLILATQRPSVDVVTGLIKANVPSRLAFATSSLVDSRVVLDEPGAEQLLGMGDGLFKPVGARAAIRVQGAYVPDEQIDQAVKDADTQGVQEAKVAQAVAEVEAKVEEIHHPYSPGPTVIEYLDSMIDDLERASNGAADFMERLCKKRGLFKRNTDALEMLTATPAELGIATDTMFRLLGNLQVLRSVSLAAYGLDEDYGK